MVPLAVGAPPLLQGRFPEVATPARELALGASTEVTNRGPVGVVVLVDHLEGPTTGEHVATDEFVSHRSGQLAMAGVSEGVGSVAEQSVRVTGELVEVVEVTACTFDPFDGLGQLAECVDGRFVGSVIVGSVLVGRFSDRNRGRRVPRVAARPDVGRVEVIGGATWRRHARPDTRAGPRRNAAGLAALRGIGMVRRSSGYLDSMDPIDADAAPSHSRTVPPSDNTTLAAVLTGLDELGFAVNLTAVQGARLRCGRCGEISSADRFEVASIRRLEGASEADEMLSVVAAVCPRCAARGAVVLGYGPAASAEDADVSVALRAPDRPGA